MATAKNIFYTNGLVVKPTEERAFQFIETANRNGGLPDQAQPFYKGLGRCWEWTGCVDDRGYGRMGRERAHRFSWWLHFGIIPTGMFVCHKCDNRKCVNPDHLFLGDNTANIHDKERKGRGNQPTGDRHFSVTRPDRVARGDRHGSKIHPQSIARGERNGNVKLTDTDVHEIRSLFESGTLTRKLLADKFNVSLSSITRVTNRTLWKHV